MMGGLDLDKIFPNGDSEWGLDLDFVVTTLCEIEVSYSLNLFVFLFFFYSFSAMNMFVPPVKEK